MRGPIPKIDTSDRPFGLPARIEFSIDLPVPPSVNSTRKFHGAGMALLKHWHARADMMLMANRARTGPLPFRKIKGRFEATVLLCEDQTGIDLDNGIKAVLDYARRIELIPDDSPKYLRRLVVEWGRPVEGCRLTLRELCP